MHQKTLTENFRDLDYNVGNFFLPPFQLDIVQNFDHHFTVSLPKVLYQSFVNTVNFVMLSQGVNAKVIEVPGFNLMESFFAVPLSGRLPNIDMHSLLKKVFRVK